MAAPAVIAGIAGVGKKIVDATPQGIKDFVTGKTVNNVIEDNTPNIEAGLRQMFSSGSVFDSLGANSKSKAERERAQNEYTNNQEADYQTLMQNQSLLDGAELLGGEGGAAIGMGDAAAGMEVADVAALAL